MTVPLIFCLILASVIQTSATTFKCNDDNTNTVTGESGFLEVVRGGKCAFTFENNTTVVGIGTDELELEEGDSIELSGSEGGEETFKPPLDAGYLIFGHKDPRLIFKLKPNGKSFTLPFFRNKRELSINGDINNYFEVSPVSITDFTLNFTKTVKEYIHLELTGAKIATTSLNHILISNDTNSLSLPIKFENDRVVRIKTSRAHQDCSGNYTDTKETVHKISGPVASSEKSKYKCVSIFNASQLHYDVDFSDFIQLVDQDDELLLDNGLAQERVRVVKPEDQQTINTFSFSKNELAVVYNSPRVVNPAKDMQFKLTVRSVAQGGLLLQPGQLNLNGVGQVRFVLRPSLKKYAGIKVATKTKLQDANITVTSGSQKLASFPANSYLPPLIVADQPNTDLILDITANNLKSLDKVLEFVNLDTSCHKTYPGSAGSINVVQGQSCYLTLASTENVALNVDFQNGGCVKIQSLAQDRVIYDRCNLSSSELIPSFVLRQALVTIDLSNNGKLFDASLSAYRYNATNLVRQPANEVNITSPLYPTYPILSEQQVFSINGTNRSFVFSINDVDIRRSEKLSVDQVLVNITSSDIIVSNKIVNVTLDGGDQVDYDLHRGYSLTARRYDAIIIANLKKSQLLTPKNITSAYIKISAIGHRITYNLTYPPDAKNYELRVFDGRSTSLKFSSSKNFTTSDTLLISYKATNPNMTLPELKISYGKEACNQTRGDHVCDGSSRCIPSTLLCKGNQYCVDGTDIKVRCTAGPQPEPIVTGFSGASVFVLAVLLFTLGIVVDRYGPNVYKNLEGRLRSGQYTAFSSVE